MCIFQFKLKRKKELIKVNNNFRGSFSFDEKWKKTLVVSNEKHKWCRERNSGLGVRRAMDINVILSHSSLHRSKSWGGGEEKKSEMAILFQGIGNACGGIRSLNVQFKFWRKCNTQSEWVSHSRESFLLNKKDTCYVNSSVSSTSDEWTEHFLGDSISTQGVQCR